MRWKTKAIIQGVVGALPRGPRESLYYAVQRCFGAFRTIEPWTHLEEVGEMAAAVARHGASPSGASVLDVGTGHRLLIPLAWWLLGARQVTTIDLHRYLREALVQRDLALMAAAPERVVRALTSHGASVVQSRVDQLGDLAAGSLYDLLQALPITYRAPGDAGETALSAGSIDIHGSRSVFEHIPASELRRILVEARRILGGQGRLVHLVDFSDHFAAVDDRITPINFLQFTEDEWSRLAGNQFAYHNRLRSDDFEKLFGETALAVLESSYRRDEEAYAALERGFSVAARFRGKRPEDLARIRGLYALAREDSEPTRWGGNT